MQGKAAIRREHRQARRTLPPAEQRRASDGVFRQLGRLGAWRSALRVAVYIPIEGEIDTAPICRDLWHRHRRCFVPVLGHSGTMRFAEYRENSVIRRNRFGITEPVSSPAGHVPASHLDLVLAPLVAFDRAGNRLGMGGGYYDRALAFKRRLGTSRPKVYGLAHAGQEVESLPTRDWDIPLDGIITPRELIVI